jgi:hypothetical protein
VRALGAGFVLILRTQPGKSTGNWSVALEMTLDYSDYWKASKARKILAATVFVRLCPRTSASQTAQSGTDFSLAMPIKIVQSKS